MTIPQGPKPLTSKPATGSGAAPRDYAPMYLDGGGDPSFAQIDAFLRVHFGGRAVYEAEAASAAGAAAAPHRRTEAEWATDIALTIFRQRNGMDLPYLKAEEIGQVLARWMRRQVEAASAAGAAAGWDVDRLAEALDVLSDDGLEYDLMAPEEREERSDAAERLAAAYLLAAPATPATADTQPPAGYHFTESSDEALRKNAPATPEAEDEAGAIAHSAFFGEHP